MHDGQVYLVYNLKIRPCCCSDEGVIHKTRVLLLYMTCVVVWGDSGRVWIVQKHSNMNGKVF